MKQWTRAASILAVMSMAACTHSPGSQVAVAPPSSGQANVPSQSNPPPSVKGASSKLASILKLESIGMTKEFLERTIGPPTAETEASAQYTVDGCHVTVGFDGRTVKSIGIVVAKGCHFDLARVIAQPKPRPVDASLTFAQFEKAVGEVQYHSPCIDSCGNAFDSYVDVVVPGFHANGFNDVVARAVFVQDDAIDAEISWAEQLTAAAGEDYVMTTKFNCDSSLDEIPKRLFANVKVQEIIFGADVDDSRCQ